MRSNQFRAITFFTLFISFLYISLNWLIIWICQMRVVTVVVIGLSFLIFSSISQSVYPNIIIKKDFAFIYYNLSVPFQEFSITFRSLSFNGWNMFAFSKYNDSLQDSLIFVSYISNSGVFQVNRHIGENSTDFSQVL